MATRRLTLAGAAGAAGGGIVAVATMLTIAGAVVLLFFNPAWVDVAQRRASVDRITGYPMSEVRRVTDAMIGEIYLGPGTFEMAVDGVPVLTQRERTHMGDVRVVVLRFLLVAGAGAASLAGVAAVGRRRPWFWRGMAAGAGTIVAVGLVAGAGLIVAFDATFTFFHLLFFQPGSFVFDPRIERLVQLFPEQLWVESFIAVAITGFVVALAVLVVALARLRRFAAARS